MGAVRGSLHHVKGERYGGSAAGTADQHRAGGKGSRGDLLIIDFTRVLPGVPKAKVHARVIMTTQHAKLLLRALEDNIGKFEMKFGEIKIHGEGPGGFGFQPVMPDEKVH